MTVAIVDGQEVELNNLPGISAIVHQGDMNVEIPGHYLIGPEQTLETAKGLSVEEWDAMRAAPNFLKIWNKLWDTPPPEVLLKASLASRHTIGMIMMLLMARFNNLKVHLQYPETYLHPAQVCRLMSMIQFIHGSSLK